MGNFHRDMAVEPVIFLEFRSGQAGSRDLIFKSSGAGCYFEPKTTSNSIPAEKGGERGEFHKEVGFSFGRVMLDYEQKHPVVVRVMANHCLFTCTVTNHKH